MPSSYTASARFTLQATGENNNTWGAILNAGVFQLVDDAINGRLAFALSGAKTLTTNLGATDEARMKFLDVTGGTGGTVTIPAVPKGYFVRNAGSGNVVISAGGATTATLKPGDAQPVFSDGALVHNLKVAGQTIQDFVTSQITGSGQLPPATTPNVGLALVVQAGPTWAPGQIGSAGLAVGAAAANLGYTPANRAGDTFTGNVTAPIFISSAMQVSGVAGYSNVYMDRAANTVLQFQASNKALSWYVDGAAKWSMDSLGNETVVGNARAGSFGVNGQQFQLNGDNASYSNIFLNGNGCYLQYTWANGVLNYVVNGVSCFTVDAAGNGWFRGNVTGNFLLGGGTVGTGQIQDGAVTTAKIAGGAVGSAQIANGAVGNAQMAGGAAVANIGYQPVNRNGDTVVGPLTVQGNFVGQGSVKAVGGMFTGNQGRLGLTGDDSSYSRLYLDNANGCFIHCNWNTGKISFYVGNTIIASLDSAGNLVCRGTFAFTTVPTP